jgi:hypothetical protein
MDAIFGSGTFGSQEFTTSCCSIRGPGAFQFQSLKVAADQAKLPHTLTIDGVKYQTYELTGAGVTREGESGKAWKCFDPTKSDDTGPISRTSG